MSSEKSKDVRVAVVGGGLVGALQACVLAKKGYREVHLYEVIQFSIIFNDYWKSLIQIVSVSSSYVYTFSKIKLV